MWWVHHFLRPLTAEHRSLIDARPDQLRAFTSSERYPRVAVLARFRELSMPLWLIEALARVEDRPDLVPEVWLSQGWHVIHWLLTGKPWKPAPVPVGLAIMGGRSVGDDDALGYALLLPLAVVEQLVWLTIPVTVLVCLSFTLISEAGRVLEDPFTLFWNGLPLNAICRTIENDLRNRLGETELPAPLRPDGDGILM